MIPCLAKLLAPQLVAYLGWPGLFATLGVSMLSAGAVLQPAVAIEKAGLAAAASEKAGLATKKTR